MTANGYVQSVLDQVPQGLPLRESIAMELRGHIDERTAAGQPLDQVLQQLGDPLVLAESYLSAVPMTSAATTSRIVAKIIDTVAVVGSIVAVSVVAMLTLPAELRPVMLIVCLITAVFGFVGYTIHAEYRNGQTIGKRAMGIQVVRESGARISLMQSCLRQVPFFGQFYFIDALFVFFTDRRQRAFEMLTKTRAVVVG